MVLLKKLCAVPAASAKSIRYHILGTKLNLCKTVFHMQTKKKNIRKGNLYFPKCTKKSLFLNFLSPYVPKCINSIFQSSVVTTGKYELIEKITLYVISGLVNTLIKQIKLTKVSNY